MERSLALLRKEGYAAEKVERPWNPHSRKRKDLFGVFDVLAVHQRKGILGVQVTTDNGKPQEHRDKFHESIEARMWFFAGGKIEMHIWGKKGVRGKRKFWKVQREAIVYKGWV